MDDGAPRPLAGTIPPGLCRSFLFLAVCHTARPGPAEQCVRGRRDQPLVGCGLHSNRGFSSCFEGPATRVASPEVGRRVGCVQSPEFSRQAGRPHRGWDQATDARLTPARALGKGNQRLLALSSRPCCPTPSCFPSSWRLPRYHQQLSVPDDVQSTVTQAPGRQDGVTALPTVSSSHGSLLVVGPLPLHCGGGAASRPLGRPWAPHAGGGRGRANGEPPTALARGQL